MLGYSASVGSSTASLSSHSALMKSLHSLVSFLRWNGAPSGTIAHCGGPDPSRRCPFVRLSFSSASIPQLEVGISRLAEVLKKVSQRHSHVQEEVDNKIISATTMF